MAADEMLDIVDDQDRVISRAPRSRVLRDYHIHRIVVCFVFDAEDRVLVHQRAEGASGDRGMWTIVVGGHVLAGESYDAAVRRELHEETGLTVPARAVASFQSRTADARQNVKVYAVTADQEPVLSPAAVAQSQFMSIAEINQMLSRVEFVPETPQLIKILVEHTSRRESSGIR